jgi:hypothetical protein
MRDLNQSKKVLLIKSCKSFSGNDLRLKDTYLCKVLRKMEL